MAGSASEAADGVVLSVHGPAGVLDLVVPPGAAASDVAIAYADQAGLGAVPTLYTPMGVRVAHDSPLDSAGIGAGSVLVALTPAAAQLPSPGSGHRSHRSASHGRARHTESRRPLAREQAPGSLSVLWFCVSVAAAGLAGWFASQEAPSDLRTAATWLLGGAALVGVLPFGRFAAHRILAAPAFAAAAAFVVAWDPVPERLPTIIGVAALTAAVTAAVARSLDRHSEEGLRAWMIVGTAVFLVSCGAALLDLEPQVVWAVLLLIAILAARFVPRVAIDVPDQFLIDLERLAVTAWSARERPSGRRGRIVVPSKAVEIVALRGTRIITAACVAILVVVTFAAPLLLDAATQKHDWIGARCMVGFGGLSLLFAARSYRHAAARSLLRAAGLACLIALVVVLADDFGDRPELIIGLGAIVLAGLMILVAVALGRGWRSAWWSRRAEVAEGLCGSFAVGSIVVAVGLFRHLWELTS